MQKLQEAAGAALLASAPAIVIAERNDRVRTLKNCWLILVPNIGGGSCMINL